MENSRFVKCFRIVAIFFLGAFLICIPLLGNSIAISEPPSTVEDKSPVGILHTYISIISGIAEVGVVFLLYKTVKDFAELAKVSRLQTEVRFRPWIGPSSNFIKIGHDNEAKQDQYAITLKNFGEVPSSSVLAISIISPSLPRRETLKTENNNVTKFDLGPLLPNMEKKYWIFLDSEMISNPKREIFIALYFSYRYSGASSGYGMISQYDRKNDIFIHKDMWLE